MTSLLPPDAATWLARDDANPAMVVIGIPLGNRRIDRADCSQAPAAVRAALRDLSTFDNDFAIELSDVSIADWGDWPISHLDLDEAGDEIRAKSRGLPAAPFYLFLGGDTRATAPLVQGIARDNLPRTGLLSLTSRQGMSDSLSDSPFVRELTESGLPGDNIIQVGVHGFTGTRDDRTAAEAAGVRIAAASMLAEYGIAHVVDEALEFLSTSVDRIHVHCSLDVLDRASVPGVRAARAGGLAVEDLGQVLRSCARHPLVHSVDIMDLDVSADTSGVGASVMAAMLLRTASGLAERLSAS